MRCKKCGRFPHSEKRWAAETSCCCNAMKPLGETEIDFDEALTVEVRKVSAINGLGARVMTPNVMRDITEVRLPLKNKTLLGMGEAKWVDPEVLYMSRKTAELKKNRQLAAKVLSLFGPNTVAYECWEADQVLKSAKDGLRKWAEVQLAVEELHLEREFGDDNSQRWLVGLRARVLRGLKEMGL